jgi:hypothetical protein
MKANELRIGNYVDLFGMTATVQPDDFNLREHGIAIEQGKPIPLTEEWLNRFGATKYSNDTHHIAFMWIINIDNNTWEIRVNLDFLLCEIQHVHQLQNLYFALTGEELKIIQK